MSRNANDAGGCAGWFKWFVGVILTLLAAGGGVSAWNALLKPTPTPWIDVGDTKEPGFHVVEVSLRADPFDYEGPCPVTVVFSGRISVAGGAGTVSYRFLRSDGASAPIQNLVFDAPTTKDVEDIWTLGGPEKTYTGGWEAIKIYDPEETESPHAEFTLRCTSSPPIDLPDEQPEPPNITATQRWGSCSWVDVGAVASHNPGTAWCPAGSFLTQFDLDADREYSEYDTPYVGLAKCCTLDDPELSRQWGACNWVGVETVGVKSHASGPAWCPEGSFLTQFDLDGEQNLLPSDSPIVGQAMCCTLADPQLSGWASCEWQGVESIGINSHGPEPTWGPQGTFLTSFDLDGPQELDPHDAPVIGQALFCRVGVSN